MQAQHNQDIAQNLPNPLSSRHTRESGHKTMGQEVGGVRVGVACCMEGLPIDSGGHEEQVGAHEGPHQREGDGRCLIHTHQLSLVQLVAV